MSLTALALAFAPLGGVVLGIDRLMESEGERLRGERLGLVTHAAGVDSQLRPTLDRLARDERFKLVQLWGPEHGLRGSAAAGDAVADARDLVTGLPVESLYGRSRRPSPESLARVDRVLVDLQDVGSRTYTYVSTLGEVLAACAEAHKPVWVLDRPNPLGGELIEGPIARASFENFICWGPVPLVHGLTIGEWALWMNREKRLGAELEVVRLAGWKRGDRWHETGLTWTQTSPHIPHARSAHLYVATALVGSLTKNVSDGVGYTAPFEFVGASFVDGRALAEVLGRAGLAGVRFQPAHFKPFYGNFSGRELDGVRLQLDDPELFRPLRTALVLLCTLRDLAREKLEVESAEVWSRHFGSAGPRELFASGRSAGEIEASWSAELERFRAERAAILLYD